MPEIEGTGLEVLTGVMPWDQLGVRDPLAEALKFIHADWAAGLVALGAVMSMTSVLLVFQLGQPRIFFSMARDGLLPKWAAKVHPRFKTPHVTTIITGFLVGIPALFFNINEMVELTNIGTLFAFLLVSLGIIVLRVRDPHRPRPFRVPLVPFLPGLAVLIRLVIGVPMTTAEYNADNPFAIAIGPTKRRKSWKDELRAVSPTEIVRLAS